ncbi:unnamed protein product [Citrullus colocynthis]|uniref:Uncharacterized protein n=1 Tax=Citrullus colocynthis TaxID=252529 RepID=A0ABP0XVW2_9ROSI
MGAIYSLIAREEAILIAHRKRNGELGVKTERDEDLELLYLGEGRFEEAEKEVEEGLRLLLTWGSAWDKRMPWQALIAWGRVLLMKG